jgi:hypothetical protein
MTRIDLLSSIGGELVALSRTWWKLQRACRTAHSPVKSSTDKKENQIFLIFKEIQNGAVAKSFMNNGLLIYGEKFAHFLIY